MPTLTREILLDDLPESVKQEFPNREKVLVTVSDTQDYKEEDYTSALKAILDFQKLSTST